MDAPLCRHLARGARQALECVELPPASPQSCTRVVAVSDTHCQTEHVRLPPGDVLVHAGDVLTESGLRHVEDVRPGQPLRPTERGVELVHEFAKWFGAQPHPHKILVAGNHDKTLQAMGAEAVRSVLDTYSRPGSVVYLEHETATLRHNGLRAFGTPYGYWGSHNDAFAQPEGAERDYYDAAPGTHIYVTHTPPILPGSDGQRETAHIVDAVQRSGAHVHVSGHCHWAHGLYFSERAPRVPFVVASVCDSKWERFLALRGPRGDAKWDYLRGGYNVRFLPYVVDIAHPAPAPDDVWVRHE